MICNSQIQNDLIKMDESVCPFCNQLLIEGNKDAEPCCIGQEMANKSGMNLCLNCGIVHTCDYANEYIDFYENIYRIRRKSVYHRLYHVEKILNNLCFENGIVLTHDQRDRIYKIFIEIGAVIPSVNKLRRRMISTKYILRQLFKLLDLPFECIKITKSRKTLEFYNRYWAKILELKFDSIMHIIE